MNDPFQVRRWAVEHHGGMYRLLDVDIVPTSIERIVPPAGEEHAFDVQHFRRRIQVSVSPTGRSVQIYVDGQPVKFSANHTAV